MTQAPLGDHGKTAVYARGLVGGSIPVLALFIVIIGVVDLPSSLQAAVGLQFEDDGRMHLADFTDLAQHCREHEYGLAEFLRQDVVIGLHWPVDVLEQWVYDHADNGSFLRDYESVDLSRVGWQIEALSIDTFMAMPTGPSEPGAIEYFAADPDHWVSVRDQGQHLGVRLAWETHGTWKRWPIVLDRCLLSPVDHGLQLVEGRNRVGILRGRQRQGKLVASKHLAWVGRHRT